MNAAEKVKQALGLWGEGQRKFDEANLILSSGPSSHYYKKINGYVTALFGKFAPFKEGDTVKIIKAPNTNNGWSRCKHFLVKGAQGTVLAVDYYDDAFCADVVWDNETWIDQKGVERPVDSKHTFKMWEGQISAGEAHEAQS